VRQRVRERDSEEREERGEEKIKSKTIKRREATHLPPLPLLPPSSAPLERSSQKLVEGLGFRV